MSHVLHTRTQHTQSSARESARHRPVLSQLGPCPRPFFLFVRCSNAAWIISTPSLPSRDHRPVLCVDTIRVEALAIAQRLHSLKFTSYSDPPARHRTLFLLDTPRINIFGERKASTNPSQITRSYVLFVERKFKLRCPFTLFKDGLLSCVVHMRHPYTPPRGAMSLMRN